ncbi:hypothetical protein ACFLSQ_11895 [Bacteroidota bacterium]
MIRIVVFLLLLTTSYGQVIENYKIFVDSIPYDFGFDKVYTLKTKSGEKFNAKIVMKDTLTYNDGRISFKYLKENSLTVSDIVDTTISGISVLNTLGNGFTVQIHSSFNPSIMLDAILSKIIQRYIRDGYVNNESKFTKTLKNGQEFIGKTSLLKLKEKRKQFSVAVWGENNRGFLIIMMLHNFVSPKLGEEIIDLLWDSLEILE